MDPHRISLDDVSLIGYGENVLQMASPVAVTAYVSHSEDVGERLAEVLLDMIDGRIVSADSMAIAGEIVERDSVRRIEATVSF